MPVTLAQFAQSQIEAQRLPVKVFARRAGLGLSHAYQILRGERPRAEAGTFDAVARGLGMTPAEMAIAMGRGSSTADPEEAEFVAILRQVPIEKRSAARDMLLGLAVQPVNKGRNPRVTGLQAPTYNRPAVRRLVLDEHTASADDNGAEGPIPLCHPGITTRLAAMLAAWLQPLTMANPFRHAPRPLVA